MASPHARFDDPRQAVAWLRTPEAIRSRCGEILALAERDALAHFALDEGRLEAVTAFVVDTTRRAYPDLEIPFHSRWRHFAAGGVDRWSALAEALDGADPPERARIRTDLAVTSVFLDAGAGARWRYREPGTGLRLGRSEGLAAASFHLYARGALSSRSGQPLRADAGALKGLSAAALADAFQVSGDNPMVGVAERAGLLNRLGESLEARPDLFGPDARVGALYDALAARARGGRLPAPTLLSTVLEAFAAVWPGRCRLAGVNLGDVGRHAAIRCDDLTDALVPFHKLSQWLAYSLVEPLHDAGITVTELDALTALPEYRNGGLLVDLGLLALKDPRARSARHPVDSELIVEWRALTVALLERVAGQVRAHLGLDAERLPLARVLEGGTWRAGRRAARERRADGSPPIQVESDGTVF